MKFHLASAALISLALLVTACGPAAEKPASERPTQAEDVAAIKSLFDARSAANNAGDASAVAALFTDDAILIRSDGPTLIGKEALLSKFQAHHDQLTEEITGELVEVEAFGDWAFDRGNVTIKLTPKDGGEPTELNVRFIDILRRQPDGSWKIYRGMADEFSDHQEE